MRFPSADDAPILSHSLNEMTEIAGTSSASALTMNERDGQGEGEALGNNDVQTKAQTQCAEDEDEVTVHNASDRPDPAEYL